MKNEDLGIILLVVFLSGIMLAIFLFVNNDLAVKKHRDFSLNCLDGYSEWSDICVPNEQLSMCDIGWDTSFIETSTGEVVRHCVKDSTPFGIKCQDGYGVDVDAGGCVRVTGYWKEKTFEYEGNNVTYNTVVSVDEYQRWLIIDLLKNSTGISSEEHEEILESLK